MHAFSHSPERVLISLHVSCLIVPLSGQLFNIKGPDFLKLQAIFEILKQGDGCNHKVAAAGSGANHKLAAIEGRATKLPRRSPSERKKRGNLKKYSQKKECTRTRPIMWWQLMLKQHYFTLHSQSDLYNPTRSHAKQESTLAPSVFWKQSVGTK